MKSNFANLGAESLLSRESTLEISGLRMLDANAEAGSPFAGLGYKADDYKAYIEFTCCHSLPVVIGPTQEGSYIGMLPDTLSASHASLLHQQVNIRHLLKAYNPEQIARDRIIGCVVATWFPKAPLGGWQMPASAEQAPAIKACAVVFKLAEGVPGLLGKHVTSREKQSVSIENITTLNNIGLWLASKPDVIVPLLDPGDYADAVSIKDNKVSVGKVNGEQAVMVYGLNGRPTSLRGVGVTPRPAERVAKITSVNAEENVTELDGGSLHAMAAETHAGTLEGTEVRFRTGRRGIIREVFTDGIARLGGLRVSASAENPALRIEMPDRRSVLCPLKDVAEKLSA